MSLGLRPQITPPLLCNPASCRILFNYLLETDFYTGHHDEPRFQQIIKILAHAFTRVSNLLYRTCTVYNIVKIVHNIRYTSPARQNSKTCNNILKYVRPKNNIYKKASFSIAQNIVSGGGGSCGRRSWLCHCCASRWRGRKSFLCYEFGRCRGEIH
jgi:hypothetical protein